SSTEPTTQNSRDSGNSSNNQNHKTSVSSSKKDRLQVKSRVWADSLSRGLIDLNISGRSNVYDVVNSIIPFANRRTSMSIVTKLILAASTYFIWQERNERLFNNQHRSVNQVIECISASIRLKLISCRFKRSTGSLALLRRWKLPDVLIEQK
ncbi:hypothetical protein Tco_1542903, partial [Tanacetum coccineum]